MGAYPRKAAVGVDYNEGPLPGPCNRSVGLLWAGCGHLAAGNWSENAATLLPHRRFEPSLPDAAPQHFARPEASVEANRQDSKSALFLAAMRLLYFGAQAEWLQRRSCGDGR